VTAAPSLHDNVSAKIHSTISSFCAENSSLMAEFDTDLFVIGGGSGGVRAARIASQRGARVTLAEQDRLGGTCVIRGCVPKKLMVYASKVGHDAKDAAGFGWTVPDSRFDWSLLKQNIHNELDRLENAYSQNLQKAGVTIVHGRAVIRDRNTVVLANGAAGSLTPFSACILTSWLRLSPISWRGSPGAR
jgi:glutathione reductase (NADPH)